MKRLLVSAIALMVGTLAFAQVSGDPAAPTIEDADNLSPDPLANRVENTQGGIANYLLVRQEGTSSSIFIDQAGGDIGIGNLIYVRQSGNVSDNTGLSGQENRVDIRQAGFLNQSYAVQSGDRNDAGMRQDGLEQVAYILQGNNGNAEDNYAGTVQTGEGHTTLIEQTQDNNEALSIQSGEDNASKIKQDVSGPDNSPGHNARVEQSGSGQMSSVRQGGNSQDADITQAGMDNYSGILQTGLGPNFANVNQNGERNKAFGTSFGMNQTIDIDQTGDDNATQVNQNGPSFGNSSVVVQFGTGNYGKQSQNNLTGPGINQALINQGNFGVLLSDVVGELSTIVATNDILNTAFGTPGEASYNGVAYQTQNGQGNVAASHQFGDEDFFNIFTFSTEVVGPNFSRQVQVGNDNEAVVVQNAFQGSLGSPIPIPEGFVPDGENNALQVQTGDGNVASIIQRELGNESFTEQNGMDSALGVQIGFNNTLFAKQFEGANYIETGQAGINMDIIALQRGGQSFIGNQFGLFNTMEVLQVGPAGNIDEYYNGCIIPDPLAPMPLPPMQDLTFPVPDVPVLCTDC